VSRRLDRNGHGARRVSSVGRLIARCRDGVEAAGVLATGVFYILENDERPACAMCIRRRAWEENAP